jgi:hypothetical protein
MRRIWPPADTLAGPSAAETAARDRSTGSSAWQPCTSFVSSGPGGGER